MPQSRFACFDILYDFTAYDYGIFVFQPYFVWHNMGTQITFTWTPYILIQDTLSLMLSEYK